MFCSPGRISILAESSSPISQHSGKLFATQRWNLILGVFYEQMPLKRHWKLLWPYENSFTGKEAVDFMLKVLPKLVLNVPVYRSNCFQLLQRFLKDKLIANARNPKDLTFFDDGTVYKFNDNNVQAELSKLANSSFSSMNSDSFSLSGGIRRTHSSSGTDFINDENKPEFIRGEAFSSFRTPQFRKSGLFASIRRKKNAPPVFVPPPPPPTKPPPPGGQATPLVGLPRITALKNQHDFHRKRPFAHSSSPIPSKIPRNKAWI
uniref:DEP domain-containing protein n=1 Tax=Panagrolaimus sp. JU765 TaxID=591449 RepID=A0AC34QFW6_9BILA